MVFSCKNLTGFESSLISAMMMKLGWLLSIVFDTHFTGKKSREILVSKKVNINKKIIVWIPSWHYLTLCKFFTYVKVHKLSAFIVVTNTAICLTHNWSYNRFIFLHCSLFNIKICKGTLILLLKVITSTFFISFPLISFQKQYLANKIFCHNIDNRT